MKNLFSSLRLVAGLLGLASIVATFFDTASRVAINPFNFFGFFTMQSNIIFMVVMFVTAIRGFRRVASSARFDVIRGCATTYIVIVGVVYNTLLAGLEGGVTLAWANTILHVFLPIYAAIDWVIFSDRSALRWRLLWVALIYPIVWVIVVLIRGATDGWVPYPFLDPTLGYPVVSLYCVGIAVGTIGVASAVWMISRVRIIGAPAVPPNEAAVASSGDAPVIVTKR